MSVAEVYCRDISRDLLFLPTWPPGAPMAVGRVGRFFADRVFDPETSLSSYGIEFTVESQLGGSQALTHTSEGVNEFGVSVGAKVPDLYTGTLTAGAKTTVSFARQHDIVFRASGLRYRTMQDQPRVARSVASLIDRGEWSTDWYLVTQTVEADVASILVSNAASAEVEFFLSADAHGLGVELLGAEFKPRVVRQNRMNTVMVNEGGLVPLFRAKRVRHTLFGNMRFEPGFGRADVTSMLDLNDDELQHELFEDVQIFDQIVVASE